MNSSLNRRLFLKRAAVGAGALTAARYLPGPNLLAALSSADKLNCVQIGCGGRGLSAHLAEVIGRHGQNPYAIVDPDENRLAAVKKWLKGRNLDPEKVRTFADYRTMFDKVGKQIDAVFVAAPNHHHALASLIALQLGKNVYCEKPVATTSPKRGGCVKWRASPRWPRRWAIRDIAWKAISAFANTSGRGPSAR
jgi:hypothetical protein